MLGTKVWARLRAAKIGFVGRASLSSSSFHTRLEPNSSRASTLRGVGGVTGEVARQDAASPRAVVLGHVARKPHHQLQRSLQGDDHLLHPFTLAWELDFVTKCNEFFYLRFIKPHPRHIEEANDVRGVEITDRTGLEVRHALLGQQL